MRASGVQWQRNGPRRTRAHSRPPGARVPEPGSPALGAWPRAGHSELKTGAVSTRADEKITQFPQNPIFKTASGVWLWVRRRNCARSRPQLPSGQRHGGTPRGWALHSPGGGGRAPGAASWQGLYLCPRHTRDTCKGPRRSLQSWLRSRRGATWCPDEGTRVPCFPVSVPWPPAVPALAAAAGGAQGPRALGWKPPV